MSIRFFWVCVFMCNGIILQHVTVKVTVYLHNSLITLCLLQMCCVLNSSFAILTIFCVHSGSLQAIGGDRPREIPGDCFPHNSSSLGFLRLWRPIWGSSRNFFPKPGFLPQWCDKCVYWWKDQCLRGQKVFALKLFLLQYRCVNNWNCVMCKGRRITLSFILFVIQFLFPIYYNQIKKCVLLLWPRGRKKTWGRWPDVLCTD